MRFADLHLDARVTEFLRHHSLLSPGVHLLVAASGGCDSTVLAHVSAAVVARWKGALTIATVHHGLREEADEDVVFVRSLAEELGAGFLSRRVEVPRTIETSGGTIQDVARRLRYDALEDMCTEAGATLILTAHHADDQAETLLAHFLRGAGPEGLTGIRPIRGRIVRPLLAVRRQQLEDWAVARGITWRHDASNESDKYRRNALRHHVLPAISTVCGGGWVQAVGSAARLYSMLGTFIEQRRRPLVAVSVQRETDSVMVREKCLNTSSEFEKLVVCRHALLEMRGTEVTLDESLKLLSVLEGPMGTRQHLRGGVTAFREVEGLRLVAATEERAPIEVSAGETVGWGDRMLTSEVFERAVAMEVAHSFTREDPAVEFVDLHATGVQWRLRRWLNTDHFEPLGFGREKRVRDFLADSGIKRAQRRHIPVLEGRCGIFWVCGVRLGQHAAVHRESTRIARLHFFRIEQDDS
jgi:tRNA(Ile)-lysidine synthase